MEHFTGVKKTEIEAYRPEYWSMLGSVKELGVSLLAGAVHKQTRMEGFKEVSIM